MYIDLALSQLEHATTSSRSMFSCHLFYFTPLVVQLTQLATKGRQTQERPVTRRRDARPVKLMRCYQVTREPSRNQAEMEACQISKIAVAPRAQQANTSIQGQSPKKKQKKLRRVYSLSFRRMPALDPTPTGAHTSSQRGQVQTAKPEGERIMHSIKPPSVKVSLQSTQPSPHATEQACPAKQIQRELIRKSMSLQDIRRGRYGLRSSRNLNSQPSRRSKPSWRSPIASNRSQSRKAVLSEAQCWPSCRKFKLYCQIVKCDTLCFGNVDLPLPPRMLYCTQQAMRWPII